MKVPAYLKKRIINFISNPVLADFFKWFKNGPTVIAYHGVIKKIEDARIQGLHIEEEEFRHQLEYLKNNYKVISIDVLNEALESEKKLNSDEVVITFDDGYLNVLNIAAPILREFGFPFTVFVNTAYSDEDLRIPTYYLRLAIYYLKKPSLRLNSIGKTFNLNTEEERNYSAKRLTKVVKNIPQEAVDEVVKEIILSFPAWQLDNLNRKFSSERLLNWEQIKALKNYEATIGSHCHRHTILNKSQQQSTIISEFVKSKKLIRKYLGGECKYFAYPNGSKSYISLTAYKAVGEHYVLGFTTEPGEVANKSDLALLPRIWAGPSKNQMVFSLSMVFRKNRQYMRFMKDFHEDALKTLDFMQ